MIHHENSAQTKREYDKWHARRSLEEGESPALHSWHHNVARLIRVNNGQRVLEVGCGNGEFAAYLAKRFVNAQVVAVDFSQEAIGIARGHHTRSPNLRFETSDATALAFDDRSFDCVVSCECIEHVLEPQKMASEIFRVLRPGGAFHITTENYFNGMALMWAKAIVTGVPIDTGSGTQPHENFFLFWRVRRMLEKSGLSVRHTESDCFQWLMLPRVNPSTLCTVDFDNPFLKRVFRPFGRHFTFSGVRQD